MERTTDRIELRGLRATAVVGLLPEERIRAQPIEVDLDLWVDLSAAGVSDLISDTIDYAQVCDRAVAVIQLSEPRLLERLAAQLADSVLGLDPRIEAVEVALRKLRPPVAHLLASSGVRITRRAPRESEHG